jgi:hypothetical protein
MGKHFDAHSSRRGREWECSNSNVPRLNAGGAVFSTQLPADEEIPVDLAAMPGLGEFSPLCTSDRGATRERRALRSEFGQDFWSATEAVPIRTISAEIPDLGLGPYIASVALFLSILHLDLAAAIST